MVIGRLCLSGKKAKKDRPAKKEQRHPTFRSHFHAFTHGTSVSLCVPRLGGCKEANLDDLHLQKRDLRLRGAEPVCESGGLVLECVLLTTGTHRFSETCLMTSLLYLLHLLPGWKPLIPGCTQEHVSKEGDEQEKELRESSKAEAVGAPPPKGLPQSTGPQLC